MNEDRVHGNGNAQGGMHVTNDNPQASEPQNINEGPHSMTTIESVVDGVDRMRDEGGIAPEIPHRAERVQTEHGSVNPEEV